MARVFRFRRSTEAEAQTPMTMTDRPGTGRHLPGAGSAAAAAVERPARRCSTRPSRASRTRIGADVVCEALLRQGVDVLFGYPGGVILPLYDVLGDYPELRHVLVRHEQGARPRRRRLSPGPPARSASAWAPPAPAPRTSSPASARPMLDSVPIVAITGNVAGALLGKDAFQEIDITGITLPMTKHNYLVRDADDLPARLRRGVPHRPDRPARARSTSTSPRTPSSRRRAPSTRPRPRSSPACPASGPNLDGHPRQLKLAAAEIAAGQAAGHPGRPRRPASPRRWDELRALRREGPDPGRPHAARDRRDRRDASRSPTATWACTAGSTSTGRSSRPTC